MAPRCIYSTCINFGSFRFNGSFCRLPNDTHNHILSSLLVVIDIRDRDNIRKLIEKYKLPIMINIYLILRIMAENFFHNNFLICERMRERECVCE